MGDNAGEEGAHYFMGIEREQPDQSASARPLAGRRVLVTRAREQAGSLSAALRAAGAGPVEAPLLRNRPAGDYAALHKGLPPPARHSLATFPHPHTPAHTRRPL